MGNPSTLLVCPACARHVKCWDAACPFCQAKLSVGGKHHSHLVVGAALLVAACGPPAPAYGPPPEVPEPPAANEAPSTEPGSSPSEQDPKSKQDEDPELNSVGAAAMYAPPPGP